MEAQETKSLKENIVSFIVKARMIFLIAGIVIVVALVALIVMQQLNESSKNQNGLVLDALDTAYTAWQSESDEAKKSELSKSLEDTIKASLNGSDSAKQYGLFVQGNYLYEKKSYAEAAKAYEDSAKLNSGSYLYEIDTVLSADAYEESGDIEKAKAQLKIIADASASAGPMHARALFSLARILDSEGKTVDAKAEYQKIIDAYPDSSWTKLAHDRIIYLDIKAQ